MTINNAHAVRQNIFPIQHWVSRESPQAYGPATRKVNGFRFWVKPSFDPESGHESFYLYYQPPQSLTLWLVRKPFVVSPLVDEMVLAIARHNLHYKKPQTDDHQISRT